ncbi:MAG: GTP-dependent dephospho-CoA kinase family protein [Nitrososphaera sp.]|jgi:uncharacterized protein (UPF0218 family)
MPLTPAVLAKLKKPFGILVPASQVTKPRVISEIKGAPKVIAVGDATTDRLLSFGIVPNVAIVDGKERRHARDIPDSPPVKDFACINPAGTISGGAIELLKTAMDEKQPVRIVVKGEEDLLALPAFVMAPDGAAVLYGQPLEGLVIVRITPAKREEAKILMQEIRA